MKSKTILRKIGKIAIYVVIIAFLLSLILVIGLKWYINNHKEEVVAKIENLASNSIKGDVKFDSIDMSSIKKFPDLSVSIYNISVTDSLYEKYQKKALVIDELIGSVSVVDLWDEEITINSVDVEGGQCNLFVMEDGYTNNYVFQTIKKDEKKQDSKLNILEQYTKVNLSNFEFWFREKIKNKRITAHINDLNFEIDPQSKDELIPEINLDVQMKELGLNLAHGAFFNNQRVVATIVPNISEDRKTMDTDWFDMAIGDQEFYNKMFINFDQGSFVFNVTIEGANYKETVGLLTQNIQEKLNQFELSQPVNAQATIDGKFEYRNNPVVTVNFQSDANDITIPQAKVTLDDTDMKGYFENRIYDDPAKQKTESVKNFRLVLDVFDSHLDGIPYTINNGVIMGTDKISLYLNAHLRAHGQNKDLSKLIDSENYALTTGDFTLTSDIKGKVLTLPDIFSISKSAIEINNCTVVYKPENLHYKLKHLDIDLDNKETLIKDITVTLKDGNPLTMNGELNSFAYYFDPRVKQPPKTILNVYANYLNVHTLIETFALNDNNKPKKKSPQQQNLALIKRSLNGNLKKFNPTLNVRFKKLKLMGEVYDNVTGNLIYQGNSIFTDNLKGDYQGGSGNLNLNINLAPLKDAQNQETLKFSYSLKMNGQVEHIVQMLKNDNFFFTGSDYVLTSSFNGNANDMEDIFKQNNLNLDIGKGTMEYKAVGLTFDYDRLSLSMANDDVKLKDFTLNLPNNKYIRFSGTLDNVSTLIYDTISGPPFKSNLTIYSPDLNLNDLVGTLNNQKPNSKNNQGSNLKTLLKDVYKRYNPSLNLDVAKLTYKNTTVTDIKSKIYYPDANHFRLKDLGFKFLQDQIYVDLDFDLGQSNKTPFTAKIDLQKANVANVLQEFNNFNFQKLADPTEISGFVTAKIDLKADIDDQKEIDKKSIQAVAVLDLDSMRIKNFEPIINIGNILFKKARFEDIRILPVHCVITVKDQQVYVDATEIQSSALDATIEGVIDNQDGTHVWIGVPWENFKKRNYQDEPKLKQELQSEKKFYIEIISDENGNLKYKLHLGKKKYEEAKKKQEKEHPNIKVN